MVIVGSFDQATFGYSNWLPMAVFRVERLVVVEVLGPGHMPGAAGVSTLTLNHDS